MLKDKILMRMASLQRIDGCRRGGGGYPRRAETAGLYAAALMPQPNPKAEISHV